MIIVAAEAIAKAKNIFKEVMIIINVTIITAVR